MQQADCILSVQGQNHLRIHIERDWWYLCTERAQGLRCLEFKVPSSAAATRPNSSCEDWTIQALIIMWEADGIFAVKGQNHLKINNETYWWYLCIERAKPSDNLNCDSEMAELSDEKYWERLMVFVQWEGRTIWWFKLWQWDGRIIWWLILREADGICAVRGQKHLMIDNERGWW